MKAVVLAAGPPKNDFPPGGKPICLHHQQGRTLLERIVQALRQGGVKDIRVVVGYRAEAIAAHARQAGLGVELVTNDAWREDSIRSIEVGLADVEDDVLLLAADLVIDAVLVQAFLATDARRLAWIRSAVPWDRDHGDVVYDAVYRNDIDNSVVKIPRHLLGIFADAREHAARFVARYAWLRHVHPRAGVYYGAAITELFAHHPPVEEIVIPLPLTDVDYFHQTDESRVLRRLRARSVGPRGAPADWRPCTAETARCEFWTWAKDYLRPDCCTDHLRTLLFFTEDLLGAHGIRHWIDYGTLLGAARDEQFIPWDSDVDIGVLREDRGRILALGGEIARAGHRLDTRDPNVWRIAYSATNTQHVDLYPWWPDGESLKMTWPGAPPERWAFPASRLDELARARLYGRTFPAPSDPGEFLARYRYGPDVRTPRRPVLSEIPDIPVHELTPVVGGLLETIRDRDYRLAQVTRATDARAGRPSIEDTVRSFAARRRRIAGFESSLVQLHDVLESTPLAGRYWVIGGLLIGWAREGRVLPHDHRDADFAFLRDDGDAFLAAVPALARAGFRPLHRYVDGEGRAVEYKLTKDGANFDFFVHERRGASLRYRYLCYPQVDGRTAAIEVLSEVPAYGLAPMPFLGRTWRKPEDHEAYLTAIYGPWRVPDPGFSHPGDDRSVVGTRSWTGSYDWPLEDRT